MRLSSGPGAESGGNWIILVALVAAFAAIVAAIFELKQDGAKYAKAFVREDALRILIVSELSSPFDAILHEFAQSEGLELERLYRPEAQIRTWAEGAEGAEVLPPIDGVITNSLDAWQAARPELVPRIRFAAHAESGAQPVFGRLDASGRSLALDQLEAWMRGSESAQTLGEAGFSGELEFLEQ